VLKKMLFTLQDLDLLRVPKREGVDRTGRPVSAAFTVAIAHTGWLARHLDFNSSAKTLTCVRIRHFTLPRLLVVEVD
jgi:nitric oxide synthase oxygenase domain/subunit